MLTTNILLAEKYDYLSEKFKKAFTFLRDTDLAALPVGNVPIDGNEVYANVQSYSTMDAADCPFESHKEYFDVQYVVEGEECFGYEPVENLIPSVEYDAEGSDFLSGTCGFWKCHFKSRGFCNRAAGRRTCSETNDSKWFLSRKENCGESKSIGGSSSEEFISLVWRQ